MTTHQQVPIPSPPCSGQKCFSDVLQIHFAKYFSISHLLAVPRAATGTASPAARSTSSPFSHPEAPSCFWLSCKTPPQFSMPPQGSVQGTQGCGSASCVMWARQAGCGRPSASRPLSHLLGSHLSLCSLALLFILFQVTHGLFPMASPDFQQSRALWAVISGPHHHILVTR